MPLLEIPIAAIVDPQAPVRASIDEGGIQELADSIREVGLIQPIVVRASGNQYEVIAGHRRLLALRSLSWETVTCLVVVDNDAERVMAQRLHENLIRRDMTPVEEGVVYAEMFEQCGDLEKVAKMARRSLDVVERRIALLAGDAAVRDALHAGVIKAGVAEELNKIQDETTRRYLLRFAVEEGATVGKVRAWRLQYLSQPIETGKEPERPAETAPPDGAGTVANTCWLCGSQEDQHDLRVRMVHQSCERQAQRQAERMAHNGG